MLNYVNSYSRNNVTEGRRKGLGYCFCKLEGDTLTGVGPMSSCKDFLNDQVFTEATGKPYGAWGYKAQKTGCFEGGRAHLVIKILKYQSHRGAKEETYEGYEEAVQALDNGYPKVQAFLNAIERELKLDAPTQITPLADSCYHVEAPAFWVQGTYLTSLFTLLIRVGLWYNPEVGWLAFAGGEHKDYEDGSFMITALPKLQKMIAGKVPKQDFSPKGWVDWHNCGIVSFDHPDWK